MWNEAQLDEALSTPSAALIADMAKLDGDIMILGAGGKVGPTLSVMAKRAVEASGVDRKVIAVSRFTDPFVVALMEKEHVECISCDLTKPEQIAQLPKVKNIIYMAGRKFGTNGAECETWEMNVAVPAYVTQHFGDARYVVFSTSNVYPFATPKSGGNTEDVTPSPIGEYAISCLGRERIFEYAARHFGAKVVNFRLSYAIDLRYGILYDICSWIMAGKPVAKINWNKAGKVAYCAAALLVLGAGMAMIMAFEGLMLQGILVGVVGIVLCLGMIPVCKGLK